MNRCIYCNKRLGSADTNNVCSECANERKGTHITTQPIILSRVDFSEKTPTADEVCKALSEDYKNPVMFEKDYKQFIVTMINPIFLQYAITEYKNGCVRIQMDYLKPHLIVMIGRFYEGLEVKE